MNLAEYLVSHARRQGKTFELLALVKKLNGTMVVRDRHEAERIKKEYGVRAIPYTIDPESLAGTRMGITYIDPDAAGAWVLDLQQRLGRSEAKLREADRALIRIQAILSGENFE